MVVGPQKGPTGGNKYQKARAHHPEGMGNPVQAVVGGQGGPVGGSSSQQPEETFLRGWGVPPKRRLALEEGLRGAADYDSPGTLA